MKLLCAWNISCIIKYWLFNEDYPKFEKNGDIETFGKGLKQYRVFILKQALNNTEQVA